MASILISSLVLLTLYCIYLLAYCELQESNPAQKFNIKRLIALYVLGIVVFGFVPMVTFDHSLAAVVFGSKLPSAIQVIVVIFLGWMASFVSLSQADKDTNSTLAVPGRKINTVYFIIIRIVFLVVYEMFFRGYLLITLLPFGLSTALLLNVGLYALLHCFSPKKELLACIPFGILLCALCLWLNAAWPAILIHLVLGITYESVLLFKTQQLKPTI